MPTLNQYSYLKLILGTRLYLSDAGPTARTVAQGI